jgi:hypothetical protein
MRRIGIKPRQVPQRPGRRPLTPAQIEARLREYADWLKRNPKASNPREARRGRR